MADLKISELSSNGTLDGTELVPLVQSGGNVKTLLSVILSSLVIEPSSTFSEISASTAKRFVIVDTDETNDNLSTLYFHDGTNLNWIPMVEA